MFLHELKRLAMTVNQKIRILRKEKNMTVSQLAEMVGIYQSVLTRYETGVIQYVPVELISKLAVALECKPEDLTDGDERYSQKKKKRALTLSSAETQLINNYRKLPPKVQALVSDLCLLYLENGI